MRKHYKHQSGCILKIDPYFKDAEKQIIKEKCKCIGNINQ